MFVFPTVKVNRYRHDLCAHLLNPIYHCFVLCDTLNNFSDFVYRMHPLVYTVINHMLFFIQLWGDLSETELKTTFEDLSFVTIHICS